MSDKPESVYKPAVVKRYPTSLEAEMAAEKLRANGIPAEVETHTAFDLLGHLQFAMAPLGIAVLVPGTVIVHAREILEIEASDEKEEEEEEAIEAQARGAFHFAVYALSLLLVASPAAYIWICVVDRRYQRQKTDLAEDVRSRVEAHLIKGQIVSFVGTILALAVIGLIIMNST